MRIRNHLEYDMSRYLELGLFLPSTIGGLIIAKDMATKNDATWKLN
jgi:hypothetical protein